MRQQKYNYNNYDNKSFIAVSMIITVIITILSFITYKFFQLVNKHKMWKECLITLFFTIVINVATYYISLKTIPKVFIYSLCITIPVFSICWYMKLNEKENLQNINLLQEQQYWWNLDPYSFEEEVAKVFRLYGYSAKVTPKSGDGGIDIILKKDNLISIVQCKHYRNQVPPEPIRALWGCKDDYNASEVILVASSGITESGKQFIRNKANFKVLTLNDIIKMARNRR